MMKRDKKRIKKMEPTFIQKFMGLSVRQVDRGFPLKRKEMLR